MASVLKQNNDHINRIIEILSDITAFRKLYSEIISAKLIKLLSYLSSCPEFIGAKIRNHAEVIDYRTTVIFGISFSTAHVEITGLGIETSNREINSQN